MIAAIRNLVRWTWYTLVLGVPATQPRTLYVPDPLYADYLARRELARRGWRINHLALLDYPAADAPPPETLNTPHPPLKVED